MNRSEENIDPFLVLLEQTAQGDRAAFARLYKETNHRVKVYLYRLVQDRNCIDDILVETYIQIWKNSQGFQGRSKALSWMIGIARNLALKEIGKKKYHEDIADHPEIEAAGINLEAGDRKKVFSRALARLSPKHREILDLAFYQDLAYREIAQILNISESTVKTRVFYAKASLKKALARMGIDSDDL